MGLAQAGLAFRQSTSRLDIPAMVAQLTGEIPIRIEQLGAREFDVRNPSDVMVQVFGECCFICNNDVAWRLLEQTSHDASRTFDAIGRPDFFMAFCHYDSGGSYGYALFDKGTLFRSRLQTTGVPRRPPLIEFGAPTELENRWLKASWFLDGEDEPPERAQKVLFLGNREQMVSEYHLTSRMLYELLVARLGVCPWETNLEPDCHFFRVNAKPQVHRWLRRIAQFNKFWSSH